MTTRKTLAILAAAALALAVPALAADEAKKADADRPVVTVTTNLGSFDIMLYADKAPISVANFLKYADEGFYDGTIFHRVIPGFMIQGGGFTPAMEQKKTREPIKNEAENGLKNVAGTVAMARTSVVDSATSQFFVNVKDNAFLDHGSRDFGYAVFGKVTDGMDVVKKIEAVRTTVMPGPGGARMGDVPAETVTIQSIKRK